MHQAQILKPVASLKETTAIPHKGMKIALIQTGSWGDNINSTLMLIPLKKKYPDACIEVHTSTIYETAFHNNPYINRIIAHPSIDKPTSIKLALAIAPRLTGYDIIFNPHPFYNPDKRSSIRHPELGSNIIYAWVRALEDHGIDYSLPLETILNLTPTEINKVDQFVAHIPHFGNHRKNIMEISGESGQTFFNNTWAEAIITKLCTRGEMVFISHKFGIPALAQKFPTLCYNANTLSIRECAELFNRCYKFFSVSSGLSNACNSNWCKKDIEWVEIIKSASDSSAPIRSVGKVFWLEDDLNKFLKTIS